MKFKIYLCPTSTKIFFFCEFYLKLSNTPLTRFTWAANTVIRSVAYFGHIDESQYPVYSLEIPNSEIRELWNKELCTYGECKNTSQRPTLSRLIALMLLTKNIVLLAFHILYICLLTKSIALILVLSFLFFITLILNSWFVSFVK